MAAINPKLYMSLDGPVCCTKQTNAMALLTASSAAMVFAFLPFVVMDARLDPELAWRIGSGMQVVWFMGIPVFRFRQARRLGASFAEFFNLGMVVSLVLAIVTLLINAAILGAAWPYVVGVLIQLTTAFGMFVRLLLGSLEKAQVVR